MKANHIIFYLALFLSALLFVNCNKNEKAQSDFPKLRTLAVEMVSDTGAVFQGEIIEMPEGCTVLDYGFVWSEIENAATNVEKISLGADLTEKIFKARINRAMVEGHKYYFKAFIKTNSTTVFGTELSFVSLGSKSPIITSISPTSGTWGDTITIRGKYFSTMGLMGVNFNSINGDFVNFSNSSDTVMKIKVPSSVDSVINKVSILYQNAIYPSTKVFNLVPDVEVTSISPTSGTWNSLIKIRGIHMNAAQGVYFGGSLVTPTSKSDTLIEIKVPYSLGISNSEVYLKKFNFKFYAPVTYHFIPGNISSFTPSTGTVGSLITIKCNNIRTSTANVSMLNTSLTIKSRTDSSLTVQLPQFEKSGSYNFTISDGPFQVMDNAPFTYKIPEISDIYPIDATWGDTITINGKNFDVLNNLYVTGFSIVSVSENQIRAIVPYSLEKGSYNIDIYYNGTIKIPCPIKFQLPTPVIEDVQMIKGATETYLIIKGKYFGPGTYDHSAYSYACINSSGGGLRTIYQTNNEIKCIMPAMINGTYSVLLRYYNGFGDIEKSNCITINGPYSEYYSITHPDFPGRNIRNDNNSFFVVNDTKNYLIDCYNRTVQEQPKFLSNQGIFIWNNRDILFLDYYNKIITKTNLDTKQTITLSDIPRNKSFAYSCGISYNGKYYLTGVNPNEVNSYPYTFNEFKEPNIWNKIVPLQNTTESYLNTFLYNNLIFIVTTQESWKYNPSNNALVKISTNPTSNWLTFFALIGNKAYFYTSGDEVYEYNMDLDTWNRFGLFPYNMYSTYYFTMNGKAYFVWNVDRGLKIIEFNPANIN